MSEKHSTAAKPRGKPAKPYAEFPLTPHPAGYWCKKIRGKLHYFGKIDAAADRGVDAAMQEYQKQKDDLHAGRTPLEDLEALTSTPVAGSS